MRRVLALLPMGACLALAACGGSGSGSATAGDGDAKDPIVIGDAAAKTGWMAPYDQAVLVGAEIAAAEINADGGVLGRKLTFTEADTRTDATQGGVAAQKVLSDGADFVLTTCDYDLGAPAARAANQKGILAIGCAGGNQFGLQGVGKLTFNTYSGSATEGAIMAEWAFKSKRWKRPYLLSLTSLEYTKSACDYFEKRWNELAGEGTIAGKDTLDINDTSVSAQVSRLRAASGEADVVVLCSLPPGGASAVKQIRAAGIDLPILGVAAFDGSYWLDAVPNLSDLYYPALGSIFGDDPDEKRTAVFEAYEERTGEAPTLASYPLLGYAAVESLAKAIESAGSTDSAKVAAALEQFDEEPLVTGPTTYTDACHVPAGRPYLMLEIQEGRNKYTGETVKPESVPPAPC